MIRKLLSAVSRGSDDKVGIARRPAELPEDASRLETMVPRQPPPARNDDGMHRVCEEVEKALRQAGHLR
jgi:hypothetical protein